MGRRAARAALLLLWLLPVLLLAVAPARAQQIRYGYDDLGRLQWVQDQTGDLAVYVYDPVGNILQIVRGSFPDPTAPVGISSFASASGGEGTTVTIFGRGFDPSPLQDTVTFNGTPATITAASPTQLTATVPSGATTGPIAVTAPAGTGTSAQAFTVLQAPTVSPPAAALFPRQTQAFTATQSSQWRVNDAVGGNAVVGTITQTGTSATYTAPAAVPPSGVVTITAANQSDFTLQGTATIEVLAPTDPLPSPPVSVAGTPGTGSALLPSPPVSVARLPVVTAVQPASLVRDGISHSVVLAGFGFIGATAVTFNIGPGPDGSITVNTFTVDSATQITAHVTVPTNATQGARVAVVSVGSVTSTAQNTGANLVTVP